jgi:hypothetical protein
LGDLVVDGRIIVYIVEEYGVDWMEPSFPIEAGNFLTR